MFSISAHRILGAEIKVGKTSCSGSPITQAHIDAGDVFDVACNLNGDEIKVLLDGKEYLTLCEVKAYGCTAGESHRISFTVTIQRSVL